MTNKKHLFIIGIIFTIILISGCAQKNPYQAEFAGQTLNFRADLSEAAKTKVYPNEQALQNVLSNPNIEKIKIAFIPQQEENGVYGVVSYELAYKLTIINKHYYQQVLPIESLAVNSTNDLMVTEGEPVILLLGPKTGAKQTAVSVFGSMIILEGKDFSEEQRSYTDLDLAADKLLLVLMDIKA